MNSRLLILLYVISIVISSVSAQDKSNLISEDLLAHFDGRLKIGGKINIRGEAYDNFSSPNTSGLANGLDDLNDEFLLLRSQLYFKLQPIQDWDNLHLFIQIQDSREFESERIDADQVSNKYQDTLDLHQAIIEGVNLFDSPVSLKIGRQTMKVGSCRLIAAPPWSNVPRTFDAAKATIAVQELGQIDLFAAQPVQADDGTFNDTDNDAPNTSDDNTIYGLYSSWKQVPFAKIVDLYYMLHENSNAEHEVHMLGIRSLGDLPDNWVGGGERWDWEVEFVGQFGEFCGLDHRAFATHAEMGYTFDTNMQPRLGAGYSYATGDENPADDENQTFDKLYSTNHKYYGYMNLFSWRNMHEAQLMLTAKPFPKLKTYTSAHAFFLDQPEDAPWLKAGSGTNRNPEPDASNYVGSEIDLHLKYQLRKNFTLETGYAHFFAGEYVNDTGDDDDADWVYIQSTFSF